MTEISIRGPKQLLKPIPKQFLLVLNRYLCEFLKVSLVGLVFYQRTWLPLYSIHHLSRDTEKSWLTSWYRMLIVFIKLVSLRTWLNYSCLRLLGICMCMLPISLWSSPTYTNQLWDYLFTTIKDKKLLELVFWKHMELQAMIFVLKKTWYNSSNIVTCL